MKNNVIKILPLALTAALMVTGCRNNKKPEPQPQPEPPAPEPTWSEEVAAAMELYCGEVLPYAEFNEESISYEYDDSLGGLGLFQFIISDSNETNVLEGYDEKLVAAGFEYTEFEYQGTTYISYDKTNEVGFISVDFKYKEATEVAAAGNEISVAIPQLIDEEVLLAQGYEKQTGFPAELVEETLEGSGITMEEINPDGEWFVASTIYVDEEDGSSYYCAYLVTEGDYFDDVADDFEGQGLVYDDEYGCFYDPTQTTDAEFYVSVVRNYTMFDLFGQTIEPEKPDIASEKQNEDGSITVTYTFANTLVEGTSYEETFESESCNLTVGKGGNTNNAPTYYTSGASLRCYYKNTLVFEAAQGYEIQSVNLTVGFVKNLTINDVSASAGTVSASGNVPGATVAVSGVNAGSLTITVGANATKGNVGFSAIEVVVAPVR